MSIVGRQIGPFTIERELGHGGMGTVMLGVRRESGFTQQVAIKVIRVVDDPKAVARLLEERRILATLNHPLIAHFVDGGTTTEGLPYLAMEYVEGVPVTAFCDAHGLSIRARVRLFLRVCDAVRFAHQRLVVHRDIKPSNILVTSDGTPKLLDFGIARLIDGLPDASATVTVLTPFYASPEQAAGAPVTTSTDVYSLGVLLYELVTGTGPYRTVSPQSEPFAVIDAIRHETPERPSVAAARSTRRVDEDLDAILLKALRKEQTERYGSVEQLAQDLERYLAGRPVAAHAGSRLYDARKFIARHRGAVAAASVAVISLAAAAVVSAWQTQVARREGALADARFNDVRKLANAVVGPLYDAVAEVPGSTDARRVLIKEALIYLDGLAAQAADDLDLKIELANAYEKIGDVQGNPRTSSLGDVAGARVSYEKLATLRRTIHAVRPGDETVVLALAQAEARLGDLSWGENHFDDALRQYQTALTVIGPAQAGSSEARLALMGRFYSRVGETLARMPRRGEEAAEAFERVIQLVGPIASRENALPVARRSLMAGHASLGDLRFYQGRYDEALTHFQVAMDIAERFVSESPTLVAKRQLYLTMWRTGEALEQLGRLDEAAVRLERGQALNVELVGADPDDFISRQDLAIGYVGLGSLALKRGNLVEAARQTHRGIEMWQGARAASPDTRAEEFAYGEGLIVLGRVELAQKRTDQGVEAFRQAVAVFADPSLDSRDLSKRYEAHEGLGDALSASGVLAQAREAYVTARDGYAALAATGDLPRPLAGKPAEIDRKLARLTRSLQ